MYIQELLPVYYKPRILQKIISNQVCSQVFMKLTTMQEMAFKEGARQLFKSVGDLRGFPPEFQRLLPLRLVLAFELSTKILGYPTLVPRFGVGTPKAYIKTTSSPTGVFWKPRHMFSQSAADCLLSSQVCQRLLPFRPCIRRKSRLSGRR